MPTGQTKESNVSYQTTDVCRTCGETWGRHIGDTCRDRKGTFVLATPQPKPLHPKNSAIDESFVFLGSFKSPFDGRMWDTYYSPTLCKVACVIDRRAHLSPLDSPACVNTGSIAWVAAQEVRRLNTQTVAQSDNYVPGKTGWKITGIGALQRPPDTEPAKPPLAYFAEQQAKARFDPFKDFIVHECAPVTQDIRTGCPFGAFKSPDLAKPNPLHGSAALL